MERPHTGAPILLGALLLLAGGTAPVSGSVALGPPTLVRSAHSHSGGLAVEIYQTEVLPAVAGSAEPASKVDVAESALEFSEDTEPGTLVDRPHSSPRSPWILTAAVLAVGPRSGARVIASFPLVEERIPSQVLITNGGDTVITLGGWNGWQDPGGQIAVSVYRTDGNLVRSVRYLDLLTEGDLRALQTASDGSGLPWAKTQLDESRGVLLLDLDWHHPEDPTREEPIATLEIDLETGLLRTPKRDLLPHPRSRLGDGTEDFSYTWEAGSNEDIRCSPFWAATLAREQLRSVPSERLLSQALAAPLPPYTELGRKARVTGTVVVELRLGENGEVEAACVVKDLPMALGRAALEAARRWRFRPFEVDGKPARTVGRIAFEFGWFLAEPGSP